MSSTKRSNARDTHVSDYYVTPQSCISDFFYAWMYDLNQEENYNRVGDRPSDCKWLDPCAGGDSSHPMSYPSAIEPIVGKVDTLDIRETSLAEIKGDYLNIGVKLGYYDVIITNPPFNIAESIIEKALKDVKDGGYVVMLLRLNFFGSKARFPMWQKQLPEYAYVHHRRMSFTDDGKTDSIEYMHCVWHKGVYPEFTKLKII